MTRPAPGKAEPSEQPEPDLDLLTVAVTVVVLACCGALSALIEAMLVPQRWGTVIIPIAVVLAICSNVALPVLAWRARPLVVVAAIPFATWVISVLFLSQSRPEGDVLLPGGKTGVTYVAYGLLLAGFLAGLATVSVLASRGTGPGRRQAPLRRR